MSPGAIIIVAVAAIGALALAIKTYAKQQVTINRLTQSVSALKEENDTLRKAIQKLQEIDHEADSTSDNLDTDPDAELEWMQNHS